MQNSLKKCPYLFGSVDISSYLYIISWTLTKTTIMAIQKGDKINPQTFNTLLVLRQLADPQGLHSTILKLQKVWCWGCSSLDTSPRKLVA